jgi:hypothetical protein
MIFNDIPVGSTFLIKQDLHVQPRVFLKTEPLSREVPSLSTVCDINAVGSFDGIGVKIEEISEVHVLSRPIPMSTVSG